MTYEAIPPKATRREWIGLAILALPCVVYAMDLTVLHLAVPELSADLKPSSSQLLWIIDIYGFLVAGALITMGTLGDRVGRRRLLLIGGAAFGAASVLAAFSTSAEMLIVTRAILGLAGATVAPATLSLIRNMFHDPRQRTTAIAVWITAFSVGSAIGPVVGGALLEFFWWGSVFLLAVPVMLMLLTLGPRLLPEFRDPNAGRPDILSAALSLAAVLTIIYGVKQIAEHDVSVQALALIGAGVALAAIFVLRQRRLDDPLIDLRLFDRAAFSASIAVYGLGIFIVLGSFLFLPQYLQLVRGLSPFMAGVWTLPWALAFVIGSVLTPRLLRLARPAFVMAAGLVVASLGFLLVTQIDDSATFLFIAASSAIYSLGIAPVFTLTVDLIVGEAPPERAGAASAVSETSAELGGALGIAIFGSIGVAVYRAAMDGSAVAGLPAQTAETARDTLGGAVAVAADLPATTGAALLEAASHAFIDGMQLTAAISAVGALVLAALVIATLRHIHGAPAGALADAEPADQPLPLPEPAAGGGR